MVINLFKERCFPVIDAPPDEDFISSDWGRLKVFGYVPPLIFFDKSFKKVPRLDTGLLNIVKFGTIYGSFKSKEMCASR